MSTKKFCDGCGKELFEGDECKSYGGGHGTFDLCKKCQGEFDAFAKRFQEPVEEAVYALRGAAEALWEMWTTARRGKIKENAEEEK